MIGTTSNWGRIRAKHVYRIVDERRGVAELPLLAVSIHKGVVRRDAMTNDEARADDLSSYKRCAKHDIVVNRMRAFQGAIGIAPQAGIVSPDYLVLRIVEGEPRFFHHLFRSAWFVGEMTSRLRGIGGSEQGNVRTPRINAEELGEIRISLPSPSGQRAVADYLDAETARTDALIEKKRRMIVCVDERMATITVAAILGLSPDVLRGVVGAPGELPYRRALAQLSKGWGPRALNASLWRNDSGAWGDEPSGVGDVVVMRSTEIDRYGRWRIDQPAMRALGVNDRARTRLVAGDLIVVKSSGSEEHLGKAALVDSDVESLRPGFSNFMQRLSVRSDTNPKYVWYLLNSAYGREQLNWLSSTTTGLRNLSGTILGAVTNPGPPRSTQDAIVRELDVEDENTRRLMSKVNEQIELLREHRQALITAAVTGELDIAKAAA